METAQEVDVAPGSPGTGKGANFRCANCASLGKQGRNGGALSPWSRWEPENRGQRKKSANIRRWDPRSRNQRFDQVALER